MVFIIFYVTYCERHAFWRSTEFVTPHYFILLLNFQVDTNWMQHMQSTMYMIQDVLSLWCDLVSVKFNHIS